MSHRAPRPAAHVSPHPAHGAPRPLSPRPYRPAAHVPPRPASRGACLTAPRARCAAADQPPTLAQHLLYFRPEPQGQGSLRPTVFSAVTGAGRRRPPPSSLPWLVWRRLTSVFSTGRSPARAPSCTGARRPPRRPARVPPSAAVPAPVPSPPPVIGPALSGCGSGCGTPPTPRSGESLGPLGTRRVAIGLGAGGGSTAIWARKTSEETDFLISAMRSTNIS